MSWVAENVGGSFRESGASITPRACATIDVARSACSVIAFSEIGCVAEGPGVVGSMRSLQCAMTMDAILRETVLSQDIGRFHVSRASDGVQTAENLDFRTF
ncbi:hypothetical protein CQA4T8M7_32650 [Sphaerotilus natans]|nr:hypothetical protein CQA4T8M7_32650 [Sphaerotilus natans]